MKDNRERFEPLECLLPCEREDAVSMTELAEVMEISPRELRQFILDARMEGLLILSGTKGYWESDDEREVEEYICERMEVVKTIVSYTEAMKKALQRRRESHNEEK